MTAPIHLPRFRDLSHLPHEGLPLRGEPENQYFMRLATEFRRRERSERRRRVLAWLLGHERTDARRAEGGQAARSGRALG
jgi:hypothetical protein